MAATAAGNPFGPTGGGFYLIPAMIAVALFIGTAVANQRARIAAARDKAEDEARRRVDEERLRIARELHDIVAHTMATINVQAGVAAHVLDENPRPAGDALQAIRQSSKDGLRELRAILNVLRQADEGDPTQPSPRPRPARRADLECRGRGPAGHAAAVRARPRTCRPPSTSPRTGSCRSRSRT